MTAVGVTSAARPEADKPVLSAWSTVSPFGVGQQAFRDGIRDGRSAVAEVDQVSCPGPFSRAGLVPDFVAATYLGAKGTRLMDRLTALAVTGVGGLVEQCRRELAADPERVGLVVGTGWASVQSIMDTTRASLVGKKPYHVDPAKFPNTVMNKAAGQSAIWHTVRGPNTTITGDWLTGLLALSYALRLRSGGHCDRVLCGAVEEYSVQRAWLEWHAASPGAADDAMFDDLAADDRTADDRAATPLGEGAAFFLLESFADAVAAGRIPIARVLATRFRAYRRAADIRRTLADCVRGALAEGGVPAQGLRAVAPLGADGINEGAAAGRAEEAAIRDVLGACSPVWIRCRPLVGDTSSVATGFSLAAVLATMEREPFGQRDLALVTGIGRDGTVGCALLGGCGVVE